VDTPGIHDPVNTLGQAMNAEARDALDDADMILWLLDASVPPQAQDRNIARILKGRAHLVQALNKIDLLQDVELLEKTRARYQKLAPGAQQIIISALQGAGFPALKEAIISHLPEGLPFYPRDQVTDIYERHIAADLIRAAALEFLQDEVPHAIAVRIDEYKERDDIGARISATLFVERESQKGIVVGKGGSMIKHIGTRARKAIEAMSARSTARIDGA